MARSPRQGIWLKFAWTAVLLAVLLSGGCAAFPHSADGWTLDAEGRHHLVSVKIMRTEWWLVLLIGVPTAFVSMVGLGIFGATRRRTVLSLTAVGAWGLCMIAPFVAFIRNPGPWGVGPEATDDAGGRYQFGESSFLQGQTLALMRVRDEDNFYRHYDVLVTTGGDSPRSYLRIVYPAGQPKVPGRVFFVDGWLISLRNDNNRSYMAYDLRTDRAYGSGEIENLSPFLALGEDDELDPGDCAAFLNESAAPAKGYPHHRRDPIRVEPQECAGASLRSRVAPKNRAG